MTAQIDGETPPATNTLHLCYNITRENKISFMKNITLANLLRVNKLPSPRPRRDNDRSVTVNERSPQTTTKSWFLTILFKKTTRLSL